MDTEQHVHLWRGQRAKQCACGATPDQECQQGHPRTDENAYQNARGVWACRVCQRVRVARWRAEDMTSQQHEAFKARMRSDQVQRHQHRRGLVLGHYGRKCACCGETREEFLCIDHVNGGGNAHRRELASNQKQANGGSYKTYTWLIKNGYPEGFQTLCHNCNHAKSAHGQCPHVKEGDAK